MSSTRSNLPVPSSAAVDGHDAEKVFSSQSVVPKLKPPPAPPFMLEMSFGDWKRQNEPPKRNLVTSHDTKVSWLKNGFKTFGPPLQPPPSKDCTQPKHFLKSQSRLALELEPPPPPPKLPELSLTVLTATEVEKTARLSLQQREPQIYVPRPKTFNGSQQSHWMLKPPPPPPMNSITPESREEKQRLWREYRLALKPFKNREFANAKRTIQRLGKKSECELDERELARLKRAQEVVVSHKAILSQQAALRSQRFQNQSLVQQVECGTENAKTGVTVEETTGESVE